MATVLFYFFEIIAALSAIALLFIKNVFHAALLLIMCLLSLAAIYIFGNAEFLAVTQIMIYAGGIILLVIFGIMLTSKFSNKPLIVTNQYFVAGGTVGLIIFFGLIKLFISTDFLIPDENSFSDNVQKIGITLLSDYLLPFELAGLLLLISLIGASIIASTFKSKHS